MSPLDIAQAFWTGLQRARLAIACSDYTTADAAVYALRQLTLLPEGRWLSAHALCEAGHLRRQIDSRNSDAISL